VEAKAPAGAPNILYIVLDDVGFGWADTFGGLVNTPNITRLADNGLRYTNFHTAALCSPTRACLLTGRNHHSVGMGSVAELATGYPGYNGRQPMNKAAIGAMLHRNGYTTFALGKWHNTPPEETGPTGPFDRWPGGPLFGFNRFYGFMAGDTNQWYPKLIQDNTPVDQPASPEEGYHLSADLVDKAKGYITNAASVDPDKPWLMYLAFGACHAPHHVPTSWIDRYRGKFDMGWDAYREKVLERQKAMGIVPQSARLSPMLEGIQKWNDLSDEQKRVYVRFAEVFAAFLSHTDHQIGRLIEFLQVCGHLDNTLTMAFIGDNGSSGEGTVDGLVNEMSVMGAGVPETMEFKLKNLDRMGQPGTFSNYPAGWAMAGDTPFKLCKQYVHLGGVRNPLVIHWPKGIKAKNGIRTQFHHVIDIVPTILEAIGIKPPAEINSIQQAPLEGVPMNYSFDDAEAPTNHPTQYFEMVGNRGIVNGGWKAVTHNGRLPWEGKSRYENIDQQEWELYNLDEDPAEAHDLLKGRSLADREDPIVQKLIHLVELWWADAGRYNVLPVDERLQERMAGRGNLKRRRERLTFYPGTMRIPESSAPMTKNRSWRMSAAVQIPAGGAEGPLCVMGGDTGGWSLYIKDDRPVFCYNLAAMQYTYLRSSKTLMPGRHVIRFEFRKTGKELLGAGGTGRLYIDDELAGEEEILRTVSFIYSFDETFDVGCDKGSPVTDEYKPGAVFTGKIVKIDFDLKPDFTRDEAAQRRMDVEMAMAKQ
jgi:arylsulfatase